MHWEYRKRLISHSFINNSMNNNYDRWEMAREFWKCKGMSHFFVAYGSIEICHYACLKSVDFLWSNVDLNGKWNWMFCGFFEIYAFSAMLDNFFKKNKMTQNSRSLLWKIKFVVYVSKNRLISITSSNHFLLIKEEDLSLNYWECLFSQKNLSVEG